MRVIIDTDAKNEGDDDFASCTICSLRNLTCVVSVPPISRSKPPKGSAAPQHGTQLPGGMPPAERRTTSTMFPFFMVVLPLSPPRRMLPTVKPSSF